MAAEPNDHADVDGNEVHICVLWTVVIHAKKQLYMLPDQVHKNTVRQQTDLNSKHNIQQCQRNNLCAANFNLQQIQLAT